MSTLIYHSEGTRAAKIVDAIRVLYPDAKVVLYGSIVPPGPYPYGVFVGCFAEDVATECSKLYVLVESEQDVMRVPLLFPKAVVIKMGLGLAFRTISFPDLFGLTAKSRVVDEVSMAPSEPTPSGPEVEPTPSEPTPSGPEVEAPAAEVPPATEELRPATLKIEKGQWGLDLEVDNLLKSSGADVAVLWRSVGGTHEVHVSSEKLDLLQAYQRFSPEGTPKKVKLFTSQPPTEELLATSVRV